MTVENCAIDPFIWLIFILAIE